MENRCNPVLHPQIPRGPPAPLDQGGAGGTTWVNLSGLEGVSVPTAHTTTTQLEGRSASQHPSREGGWEESVGVYNESVGVRGVDGG